jgi:AcrR family transcriptional regulator
MPAAHAEGVSAPAGRGAVTGASVRDAALTLFAERGYHGTAMSTVAAALVIRTPSLYNHIRGKQDLLESIVVETLDAVLADHTAAVAGRVDPVDRLREATRVYALRHATHRREALVVNRDTASLPEPALSAARDRRRAHETAFRSIISEGAEQGVFAVGDARLASFAILEMSVSIARWFREDGPLTAEQVADEHAEFALRIVRYRP